MHDKRRQCEAEANMFTFAFLMPEEEFRMKWQELKGNPYDIGTYFGVTWVAARTRAKILGLIPKEE